MEVPPGQRTIYRIARQACIPMALMLLMLSAADILSRAHQCVLADYTRCDSSDRWHHGPVGKRPPMALGRQTHPEWVGIPRETRRKLRGAVRCWIAGPTIFVGGC